MTLTLSPDSQGFMSGCPVKLTESFQSALKADKIIFRLHQRYAHADSLPCASRRSQCYRAYSATEKAKKQFADLVDEVVLQFTSRPGVKVKIAIEIQADSATGFDDVLQRAVKENCNVLRFKNAEFEDGE